MAEHEERIDVLVNNAGAVGEPFESPEEGWDKVMNLNLKSVFFNTSYAWIAQSQRFLSPASQGDQ